MRLALACVPFFPCLDMDRIYSISRGPDSAGREHVCQGLNYLVVRNIRTVVHGYSYR